MMNTIMTEVYCFVLTVYYSIFTQVISKHAGYLILMMSFNNLFQPFSNPIKLPFYVFLIIILGTVMAEDNECQP